MIRTPLSRSKGQGHQDALLTAALTREAGAAVTVRTYWAWETAATLRLLGSAQGARAPTGEEERGGGISCRHAHSLLKSCSKVTLHRKNRGYSAALISQQRCVSCYSSCQ